MTSVPKNMYIGKLGIVNNTRINNSIKMKPVDVKSNIYIDFNKENIKEDPKFEVW